MQSGRTRKTTERVSTECAGAQEEEARSIGRSIDRSIGRSNARSMDRSRVSLSGAGFMRQDTAPRAQIRQPHREQFVHFPLGQQILDLAKDFGQRGCGAAGPLHVRQQLIELLSVWLANLRSGSR